VLFRRKCAVSHKVQAIMFPPDVWGVIFSKLDCPRSRLCVLLADKGMPEVLAHVNVEFTSCSTSAESRIVAREAITGRRHFGAVAKPVGLRYASQVPEEQGILFWGCTIRCSFQPLWLPKSVQRLKLDLSMLDSGGSLDLIGVISLPSLCELDIRDATIVRAALDDCLCLTSLTLHCVTLVSRVPMPESLQTLSLSDCRVGAAFFVLNGADSPSFCLDLTSAKKFRELDLHNINRDIDVRLPPCVKKISMTCATVDCWQVERLLTGLTALEDVHIEVWNFGLLSQEAGPYFTESLLQTIISAPNHIVTAIKEIC